jgi:hypothetical protein
MADSHYTKAYTAVQALVQLAANAVSVGAAQDVSTHLGGLLIIQFGRGVVTALGTAPKFRVEVAPAASPTPATGWGELTAYRPDQALCISLPPTTTSNSGQTEITMTTTTGFVIGDRVFVLNTTLASSEFGQVCVVHASNHITLEENLVNTQTAAACLVQSKAERYVCAIPAEVGQFRIVADGSGSGYATYWKADYVGITGFGV